MDDLRGDQAAWGFDGESIRIRYETKGWFKSPLLKLLENVEVPVEAVESVDFRPRAGRKNGWILNLRLRERMDPFAAAGAALDDKAQPFRLTGPAKTELVAEYLADQVRFAASQAGTPDPATPTRLVPTLPLYTKTCEGTARLERDRLILVWDGLYASGFKKRNQRRVYDFSDITGAEWAPVNSGGWGQVRVITKSNAQGPVKPKEDLGALRTGMDAGSNDNYHAFLLAATVTAHLWTRDLDSRELDTGEADPGSALASASGAPADVEVIFGQIERLGDLRAKGLITDEEFNAKKAELLGRI